MNIINCRKLVPLPSRLAAIDMNIPLTSSSTSLPTNSGSWLTRDGRKVDSCEHSLLLSTSGFTSRQASTIGAKSS
ncbi:hypothetical protein AYI69_g2824 [Smittium culicis]|uniref:Uncharacterized protein n=1 Tax=Smittium culicis TaxID=133412 RepID=A0A1R1YLF3_9FUNG|nr:hypothetical protein AYI69_g2824 [Smittium culicis]